MTRFETACIQAVLDLLQQGGYGYDSRSQACGYLTREGKSCVIGLLIKRQLPEVDLKPLRGSYCNMVETNKLHRPLANKLDHIHSYVLADMQEIHDNAAVKAGRIHEPLPFMDALYASLAATIDMVYHTSLIYFQALELHKLGLALVPDDLDQNRSLLARAEAARAAMKASQGLTEAPQ